MTTTMIVLIICGIALLLIFFFIGIYNNLVRLKTMVDEAWSGIDVQLKRRYDLIPNLVATVKGYSFHEKSILEKIAESRAASMKAPTVEQKVAAENQLTTALRTLFAVVENYPDLKANQNFLSLQDQLAKIENEIQLSRRYYNGTARNYNAAIAVFPNSMIAGFSGFNRVPYFEIEAAAERQVPPVQF